MTTFGFTVEKKKNVKDQWMVYLPHSCDEWVIALGKHHEAVAELERFIVQAKAALEALKKKVDHE